MRVFQPREQMPSNCSDPSIQGEEGRDCNVDRWPAQSAIAPLPSRVEFRIPLCQLIFPAGKGRNQTHQLSVLALSESRQTL